MWDLCLIMARWEEKDGVSEVGNFEGLGLGLEIVIRDFGRWGLEILGNEISVLARGRRKG